MTDGRPPTQREEYEMPHTWVYRGACNPTEGELAFLVCRGNAARVSDRPWRGVAWKVTRVVRVTARKVCVADVSNAEASGHVDAWRSTLILGGDLKAARDAMSALKRAIVADGRFPHVAEDADEWGSVILLDHDPEMPELDRCWGIRCRLGDDGRFVVARVWCEGERTEVRDQADPVDAQGLEPVLLSALADVARRQVSLRREDEEEEDRYYEQYEQAVHEHDRHMDRP